MTVLTAGAAASAVGRGRDRNPRGAVGRKAIDAGGNGRKGNRWQMMDLAEFDRTGVAGRQRVIFTLAAAVPDRTDSMNHMPRRQTDNLW